MWQQEDKIVYVLMKIKDLKDISPKEEKLELIHSEAFGNEFSVKEVSLILGKLEKDESAIRGLEIQEAIDPTGSVMLDYYWFYINYQNFDRVYKKYLDKADFLKIDKDGPPYLVTYNEDSRDLYVNNKLYKTLNYDSPSSYFISYMCRHPNEWVKLENIKGEGGIPILEHRVGSINNILNDLGFKRNIKKAFFKLKSDKEAYFNNPATEEDLKPLGVKKLDIPYKQL